MIHYLNYLIKQRQCTETTSMIINGQTKDLVLKPKHTVDSTLEVSVLCSTMQYYVVLCSTLQYAVVLCLKLKIYNVDSTLSQWYIR